MRFTASKGKLAEIEIAALPTALKERKNMMLIDKLVRADIYDEDYDFGDILFRGDISIVEALRGLSIGDYISWDADEFKHRSFHAQAKLLGIKIATKKHKKYSCYVVLRVK
jgi:hypothetical protein